MRSPSPMLDTSGLPQEAASPPLRRGQRTWPAVFSGALLLALAWKVWTLALPPHGVHPWRDADGLGVARAFLHEGWNILYPRVAERGGLTGIVGMEFPLVNWLGAAAMALFGEHDTWARLPVWLCLIPLAFGGLALGRRMLRDEDTARVAAVCLLLQPLVLVFSRKLMPEVPMLTLLCWGLCMAFDGIRASWGRALLAGVLLALAAVLKPTGVAAAVPATAWVLAAWKGAPGPERKWVLARSSLIGLIPVVAVLVWFRHAHVLEETYGLPLFKLKHDWWEWTRELFTWTFISVVFGRCIHLFFLLPTFLWMLVSWRTTGRVLKEHPVVTAWFAASLGVVVLFGRHNFQHQYYAIPLTLATSLLIGAFVVAATRERRAPERWRLAFLAVFAVTALLRTLSYTKPPELDVARLDAAVPKLGPPGLTVATDLSTPVVSLVTLRRQGWSLPPASLTPERLEELRREGATLLVESSFGGWLPEATRARLPPPLYDDGQVRSYSLR
ncbi:glycosyltransferase family 39 protein [Corallococcus macrosporus]|uniref:Glycosyltransferase family 39 protein n=1 Tax=Corallococcus macrosporus TaxID=35 RepID=A0ABS3DPX4_9BACT|nr:glycosyltransferase family 39 protein [Corallococcus macrosporus]MBN8233382.1 glycosyltransferase family 39 protein [Corallococcus macrosporus]